MPCPRDKKTREGKGEDGRSVLARPSEENGARKSGGVLVILIPGAPCPHLPCGSIDWSLSMKHDYDVSDYEGPVSSPVIAEILGVSRRTVSSYVKRGILSADIGDNGGYLFDIATARREYHSYEKRKHGLKQGMGAISVGKRFRQKFGEDGIRSSQVMTYPLVGDADYDKEKIIAGLRSDVDGAWFLEDGEAGRLIIVWLLKYTGTLITQTGESWPLSRLLELTGEELERYIKADGMTPYQAFVDLIGVDGADAVECDLKLQRMLENEGLGAWVDFAKAGETVVRVDDGR